MWVPEEYTTVHIWVVVVGSYYALLPCRNITCNLVSRVMCIHFP
jgi:hypothetical protein